jgi:hypothetical protein
MVHCIFRLSFTRLQAQLAAEEEKFWQEQLATLLQVRACTDKTNRPLQREPTTLHKTANANSALCHRLPTRRTRSYACSSRVLRLRRTLLCASSFHARHHCDNQTGAAQEPRAERLLSDPARRQQQLAFCDH